MKVIIIGGGAAGMTAAISAARKGCEVTLLEHNDKVGRKLLATGNGRCNLSNASIGRDGSEAMGIANQKFTEKLFETFGYEDTIKFFSDLGLIFKYRSDLVYPNSDQASSVLDALRFAIRDLGVEVLNNHDVVDINVIKDGFQISCLVKQINDSGNPKEMGQKGCIKKSENIKAAGCTIQVNKSRQLACAKKSDSLKKLVCDRVILATGSKAQPNLGSDGSGYKLAQKLGHKITSITPGLVPFECEGKFFKELAGVRTPARLTLMDQEGSRERRIYSESGEVQLTAYGVSGIAAMNLSNRLGKVKGQAFLVADLLEDYTIEQVEDMLHSRKNVFTNRRAGELLNGILPKKLCDVLLKLNGIESESRIASLTNNNIKALALSIKNWKIKVKGTKEFDSAQICLGGVRIDEIKETMESCIVPGLYFAGEIVDLHGDCGGFNLQLAWTTGAIAGRLI